MPEHDFPPSPKGVPGALIDTSAVLAQEIVYAYRPDPAMELWRRVLPFLAKHLQEQRP